MRPYWQGKLVRLRAMEPDDAEFFFLINTERDVDRNQDMVYPPGSLFRQREWAEKESRQGFRDDGSFRFLIDSLDSRELVGCIDTHHCDQRNGTFSYGISLAKQYRGMGFASEAVLLVLRYYFQELRYQKVNVDAFDFNVDSIRLHERLGFVREGRRRRHTFTGGNYHDLLLFGLTVEEFRELHPEYVEL